MLGEVPLHGVRGEVFVGEGPGGFGDRALVVGEIVHGDHPIVGMVKLAPSLTPEGQREVTVRVRV